MTASLSWARVVTSTSSPALTKFSERPANVFVAEFLGDDRGLKRRLLISADVVTVRSVTDVGEFSVVASEGGLGWGNRTTGVVVPTEGVGPAGTLRSLLDAVCRRPPTPRCASTARVTFWAS